MRSLIILPALVAVSSCTRINPIDKPQQHHIAHISSNNNDTCSYNCDGWPYKQCEMKGQFRTSTCVNPYVSRSSSVIFSNYPECATVPSGCQRCDDVCSSRDGGKFIYRYLDGGKNKFDYRSQSSAPRRPSPPSVPSSPNRPIGRRPSSSQVCDYKCTKTGGCTVTYVGPPRAGKGSGSCFPAEFGGDCSGTPNECQNCNQVLSCSPEEKQQSASDSRTPGGKCLN